MTPKEMAEEQIKKWDSVLYPQTYPVALVKDFIRKAFLAGLEADRPKWHKVVDGDLPKENKRYLCKVKYFIGGDINYECFDYDAKYGSWKDTCSDIIAWCEVPQYTEEQDGEEEDV